MPEQRIPRPDSDFSTYANHYYAAVNAFYIAQGLALADLIDLKNALIAWNAAYPAHVALQAAAEGGRQTKDAAKRALEAEIRPVTAFVQGFPGTTDADRATIGITVRSGTGFPAGVPRSRPLVSIDTGNRLTHHLRVVDESTPTRAARPRGSMGAEVYIALVDPHQAPPADPAGYRFIRTITRASAQVNFPGHEGGKTAAYLVRWVSATGEPGPWSETAMATVAA